MSFLVARIDYALTRGINWLTTCLVERARGFSSSEAGDFLAAPGPSIHGYRLSPEAQARWGEPSRCPNAGSMCNCTGECIRHQTPEAGQPGENPAGVTPPTPAGSPDPSRVTVGAVRGEGSPADSDIPSSPVGERPTCECWPVDDPWTYYGIVEPGGAMEFNPDCPEHGHPSPTPGEFAAVAVREVLAKHHPTVATVFNPNGTERIDCRHRQGVSCSFPDRHGWREHVAAEVQQRIDVVITSQGPQ